MAGSWWSDAISDITALGVLLNIECIVSINSVLLLHDAVSIGSDRCYWSIACRFLCVRVTQVQLYYNTKFSSSILNLVY